jgi:hypothetical protein
MEAYTQLTHDEIYLDYLNNFITTKRMAEHYGVSEGKLKKDIEKGRLVHKIKTETKWN